MLYSKRIKELRIDKEMSQQKLGDLISVNKVSISRYEKGIRKPNLKNINGLADALQTSTDYLLGRIDDREINLNIQGFNIDDYSIIKEFRNNKKTYYKLIKNPKKYISLLVKKIKF